MCAVIRSWVRADRRALDPVLHDVVLAWLERDWPFDTIDYAPRTLNRVHPGLGVNRDPSPCHVTPPKKRTHRACS
jgi:hypothetical protein